MQRELSEERDRGAQHLAEKLLPVLDAFDAALAHQPDVAAPLHRS